MAALLHRAADMAHVPAMKETKFLLPKPALTVRDIKPAQWVNMVQSSWVEVQGLETIQAKAQVLGTCCCSCLSARRSARRSAHRSARSSARRSARSSAHRLLTAPPSLVFVAEMLSRWPLFGSSFFAVKRVSDPKERADHILALNRHGVHFIDIVTHVSASGLLCQEGVLLVPRVAAENLMIVFLFYRRLYCTTRSRR